MTVKTYKRNPEIVRAVEVELFERILPDVVCFCERQQNRLAHVHDAPCDEENAEDILLVSTGQWVLIFPDAHVEVWEGKRFKDTFTPYAVR